MKDLQNRTDSDIEYSDDFVAIPWEMLTSVQQRIVDYKALDGLISEDGELVPKRVSVERFMNDMGMARQTFYDTINAIPNFWDLVAERRAALSGQIRISKVYNGLYLKALAGNPQAAALFLANFDDNFRMPTEKKEIGFTGGLIDLIKKRTASKPQTNNAINAAIEGEIIDGNKPANNA